MRRTSTTATWARSFRHFEHVKALELPEGGSVIKGIRFETVPVYEHADRKPEEKVTIIHFRSEDMHLAFLGDLGHALTEDEVAPLRGAEIVLIPAGGPPTIDYPEIPPLLDAIGPRLVVPMHFKTRKINLNIKPVIKYLEALPDDPVVRTGSTSLEVSRETLPEQTDERGARLCKVIGAVVLNCNAADVGNELLERTTLRNEQCEAVRALLLCAARLPDDVDSSVAVMVDDRAVSLSAGARSDDSIETIDDGLAWTPNVVQVYGTFRPTSLAMNSAPISHDRGFSFGVAPMEELGNASRESAPLGRASTLGACQICGSAIPPRFTIPTVHRWGTDSDSHVYWCRDCDAGFLFPRPSPELLESLYSNQYFSDYGKLVATEQSLLDRFRVHFAWRLDHSVVFGPTLVEAITNSRSASICDMGCGNGNLLEKLRSGGFQGVGIEPSAFARKEVESKGIKVYAGASDSLPGNIPESPFDLVVMNHVLEHCLDPQLRPP